MFNNLDGNCTLVPDVIKIYLSLIFWIDKVLHRFPLELCDEHFIYICVMCCFDACEYFYMETLFCFRLSAMLQMLSFDIRYII